MSISKETIEKVRLRTRFSDIASNLPKFKKSGRGYLACCPFHDDKNPSFSISDEDGIYHCFSCGAKGSIFDYVMNIKGLSFVEAVKYLGSKVGIRVSETNISQKEREREEKKKRERRLLLKISKIASNIFRDELLNSSSSSNARLYLEKRNIDKNMQSLFSLGFSPKNWNFLLPKLETLCCRSNNPICSKLELKNALVSLGLIKKRAQTVLKNEVDYYDSFRNRIIFPITRSDGAFIAFGGRIISAENKNVPKYINSIESLIYQKRKTFFGLSESLPSIRKEREVYLVEGYLDVLSMFSYGFFNTVACCGTSLTTEHISILKRLVDKVYLLFDGDLAGVKAAYRAFELFLNSSLEVKVIVLKNGEDPDSFLQKTNNKDKAKEFFLKNSKNLLEVYFDFLLDKYLHNENNIGAVSSGKLALETASLIAKIRNEVEQDKVISYGAKRLEVSFSSYKELVKKSLKTTYTKKPYIPPKKASNQNLVKEKRREKEVNLKENKINDYWFQVITSLIIKPSLSKKIIEIKNRLKEELKIAKNVYSLILEISKKDIEGLLDVQTEPEREKVGLEFSKLISSYSLDPKPLLLEARRRLSIGGSNPEDLIKDMENFVSRNSLKSKIKELKSSETKALGEESLISIIQKKIETKRNLEKLGKQGHKED